MKPTRYRLSVLSIAIISTCYSQMAKADLKSQCLRGVPQFHGELVKGDQTQLPIQIEADNAVINQPTDATYSGNVQIQQGNRTLLADQVRLEQHSEQTRHAYLNGQFSYQDNLIQAKGQNAHLNLQSKDADLAHADYQFVGRQGRGKAEAISLKEHSRLLKNASFTACLDGDNAWSIEAKEMLQHVKEEYAEMWHARFKVLGVPVFYTPYLQFPIGDRRRSGLLIPNASHSSTNGYSYSQPIYWNIAPNMDATLTPTYFSRRGWQLSPEFRYLTQFGEGTAAIEWLKKDRLHSWVHKEQSRQLRYWEHKINFLSNWRFSVDYTKVSDKRYFTDFDSKYGNSTDGYATQNFKLGYYQPHYNLSISGKRFQTFDDASIGPYRVFPQIDFHYYQNDLLKKGDFSFFGQAAYFTNDNKLMPKAWRFHAEPSLNFPLASRMGRLHLETKLYATHYQQKAGKDPLAEGVQSNITRILPQLKLGFSTILEADKPLFSGFNQTLEPRVQYLYRPYKDQSNIGSQRQTNLGLGYDSALLQQDYFSLFNDRRYSGLDRIASANQITLGGTTRFFKDKTGDERFNFSAGQIYYLSPSRIDNSSLNSTTGRSSSWAFEANWKFNAKWNWHGSYQYDTRLNQTALSNMSLQFKPMKNNVIQVNYRFASQQYIDQNLRPGSNRYNQDIKQIGGVIGWELNDNIAIVANYYQDLALKKPVDALLALNYNTCCWTASVYANRRLIATPEHKPDGIRDVYYDNRFGINFELRFGSSYHSGINKMLKRGLMPYTEAYGIN